MRFVWLQISTPGRCLQLGRATANSGRDGEDLELAARHPKRATASLWAHRAEVLGLVEFRESYVRSLRPMHRTQSRV